MTFEDAENSGQTLSGAAAFAALFDKCTAALKKKAEVPPKDIEDLQTFIWLAAPGTEVAAECLVLNLLEGAADTKPTKGKSGAKVSTEAAGSTASSSGDTAAKRQKVKDVGKAKAMSYFD